MGVIFTVSGHVSYESRDALRRVLQTYRETNRMDEDNNWLTGSNEPMATETKTVHHDWNGIRIPYGKQYRGFTVEPLLEGAVWARVAVTAFVDSPETTLYDADGTYEQIDLREWAKHEWRPDFEPQWGHIIADEFHRQFDTEPPEAVKRGEGRPIDSKQAQLSEF